MKTPPPEKPSRKILTPAERDQSIDAFCAEVDAMLQLPPPTTKELAHACDDCTTV